MYWNDIHGTAKECYNTSTGTITPYIWEHWALVYDPDDRTWTGYKNGD